MSAGQTWPASPDWPLQLTQTRTQENKARMDLLDPKVSRQTLPVRPSISSRQSLPPLRSHHRLHPSLLQICPGLERMGENGLAASADVWFWLSGRVATDLTDTYNGFLQPWTALRHHSRHILGANRHALSSVQPQITRLTTTSALLVHECRDHHLVFLKLFRLKFQSKTWILHKQQRHHHDVHFVHKSVIPYLGGTK